MKATGFSQFVCSARYERLCQEQAGSLHGTAIFAAASSRGLENEADSGRMGAGGRTGAADLARAGLEVDAANRRIAFAAELTAAGALSSPSQV